MMPKIINIVFSLIACLLCLSLTVGCSDEVDSDSIDLPSIGGGDGGPIDDVPVGEVENSGFWINVQSDQIDLFLDNSDNFDSNCFIDKDETGFKELKCYLDIMEGDLYVHDLEIQYNAPPGLCQYVTSSPAWHWNQPIGRGPTSVELWLDTSSDTPVLDSCHAFHEQFPADGAPPLPLDLPNNTACALHNELTDVSNTNGPSCVYNASDSGLANCCVGTYKKIVHSDNAGELTRTETIEDWGGKASACLSPYLSNGWDTFDSQNFPTPKIQHVPRDLQSDSPVGLNDSIKLSSNGGTSKMGGLSTWANHYEGVTTVLPLQGPHHHTGFFSAIESNKPYAVDPITDLSGNVLGTIYDNAAWVFSCEDSALEPKQRIKLYIREWNTLTDFFLYQTSGGVAYNPDVIGDEGTDCEYDDIFGGTCNDIGDFGDLLNTSAGGNYNVFDPTAPTIDEIVPFFPNKIYE